MYYSKAKYNNSASNFENLVVEIKIIFHDAKIRLQQVIWNLPTITEAFRRHLELV